MTTVLLVLGLTCVVVWLFYLITDFIEEGVL